MASLEAGRRLADRYVLKERLGDGGHAEVWAAQDERDGRLVALKFLHLNACSAEEVLPVLRHEARMARFLEHPGVLKVEEPLRDGDVTFLPMEYAPGPGAARLRGASWRRIVPVLLEVARVLEHAHARGIVHRDIKPGNVLFDAAGAVRVADFGTSAMAGSCDAPANGSPFSASPQQLRGEAANPADDVYGMGALAYELLSRYPPFYPEFDARRVQEQDPPRPVPAQPAPDALVELVQQMLARDAAARPSLDEVGRRLEQCLALPEAEEAVVVEAPQATSASAPAARRGARAMNGWWWLGGAAVAGAIALVFVPGPREIDTSSAVAQPQRPVTRVADALVEEPAPADPAATPQPAAVGPDALAAADSTVESSGPADATAEDGAVAPAASSADAAAPAATLGEALRDGEAALTALKPAEASAAFRRALALDEENSHARQGLAAAARQQDQLAALAEGTRAEAAGDLAAARARFQRLLREQPGFAPARSALARVEARLAETAAEEELAAAAQALRRGDVEAAEAAYARAAALRPGDVRVHDGQQRIAEIRRDRRNAADLAAGTQLESGERWEEAVAHYLGVLERDAGLRFAQEGLARSERRAALDAQLADYQARPERLTAPAVRQAAQRTLARGAATASDSPRLAAQLEWLRAHLQTLSEPVRLELTSDNSTRVSVMQVGDLGSFESRALQLPPGQYTVIGQREGFRDVRYELDLAPGQEMMALSVRCTERI